MEGIGRANPRGGNMRVDSEGAAGRRAKVVVELFGVPRLRAGVGVVEVEAGDLGGALRDLAGRCPSLAGSIIRGIRLHPAYRLSLNADRFVDDPDTRLEDGDHLILLAADAGG